MKILSASYILVCDENHTVLKDGVIAFDKTIHFIGTQEEALKLYKKEDIIYQEEGSVLMPGLINPHIHLEFSANKTELEYGDFVKWLFSVIEKRETIIENINDKFLDDTLYNILKNGTTTIGAISSYGLDMKPCVDTPLNVVYFTEVLGSAANMIDTIFTDFKAKLQNANGYKSDSFIPAIAIHSPYSTHPFLIREVLKIAKNENYKVSAHFLESDAEKQWLENSDGSFKEFFNNFLNQTTSLTKPLEFLDQFKDIKDLSFTHCTQASTKELQKIKELEASIVHCPVSNRVLTNQALDIKNIDDINIALATDGLSSNISLNLFDELRAALMIHTTTNINDLAKQLLLFATNGGAKALGLKKGQLKKEYDADIITFNLPKNTEEKNLFTSIILQQNQINKVFIQGKQIC